MNGAAAGTAATSRRASWTESLMVTGLDEVMDWPAVWNPENPSYKRIWGMIQATFGRAASSKAMARACATCRPSTPLPPRASPPTMKAGRPEEIWDKLTPRPVHRDLRRYAMPEIVAWLLGEGPQDWSQIAFATDDRSASDTLEMGATDHNVRVAIEAGLAPEIAIQCVTINPARHMRLTPWVGSVAPGRFADIVLLDDVEQALDCRGLGRWAQVSEGTDYLGPVPASTGRNGRPRPSISSARSSREDFAIAAEPGRKTMQAALIRPFHWHADFITMELPVRDGAVQRDESRNVTKFAIVDRFSGEAKISRMFWRGCGPRTPDTAVGCTVAHDKHNIWVVGSSDAAMAKVVNRVAEIGGGWALVQRRRDRWPPCATRSAGLMSCASRRSARCRHAGALRRGRQRSTGCTSRLSRRAGIRAFPSG